jgi:hypothetical protein
MPTHRFCIIAGTRGARAQLTRAILSFDELVWYGFITTKMVFYEETDVVARANGNITFRLPQNIAGWTYFRVPMDAVILAKPPSKLAEE